MVLDVVAAVEDWRLPPFFAYIYSVLGDEDKAFEMLDKAAEQRDINLLGLKTHSWFNLLRSDARFQKLLARIGLPA